MHLELTGDIRLRDDSVRATNAHLSELIIDNVTRDSHSDISMRRQYVTTSRFKDSGKRAQSTVSRLCRCASRSGSAVNDSIGEEMHRVSERNKTHQKRRSSIREGNDALVQERDSEDAVYKGQARCPWKNGWSALEALCVDCCALRESYANHKIEMQRASDGGTFANVRMPD